MNILQEVGNALAMAGSMGWQILWPLVLGFTLSGVIQAVVRKDSIAKLMNSDSPRSLGIATLLGAASSSCSYAAVALARALFKQGANFTAAMAFEIASTNLVLELGLILAPFGGLEIPVHRLGRIPRHSLTFEVATSQVVHRVRISEFGGLTEPTHRLSSVL